MNKQQSHSRLWIPLALLTLASLTACAGEDDSLRKPGYSRSFYVGKVQGVTATLWTDHLCHYPEEPVLARFSIENTTNDTVTFRSDEYAIASFWLCPAFSTGTNCEPIEAEEPPIYELVLEPGERYTLEAKVRGPTKHLNYEIWGSYSTLEQDGYLRTLIRRFPNCLSNTPE